MPTIRISSRAGRKMSLRTRAALMDVAQAAIRHMAKEDSIEKIIVEAMERDGWRAFKMERNWSELKKKATGEIGMCDHLFIRYHNQGDPRGPVPYTKTRCYNPLADVLWWEFKASKKIRKRAEFLSPEQVRWIAAERVRGALVWIAYIDHEGDVAGAAQHYLDSGLCRRREVFVALIPPEARALPDRPRRLGDA